ncbi:hypothetical protein MNBD_GAMMA08-1720 [hydrothermal vent metagenome]|uniref:General secretion pathway protein L n=1 Tax=hydrothermal vent metagenome TaxID=652676 RepID=A0A3B0X9W6_9ZZZZ
MSEFLIIHYKPGQQSPMHNWALGGDAHPSITLGQGSLEELTPIARGKKVTILIDAHCTTLQSVNIPSKNRSKQLLAIPFAMEDDLAEDIDDTHFALGKQSADNANENKIPVIAIKRTLLQQTLTIFNQQNIHVDVISADSVALPGSANQWCLLLDEDSALIKTSASQAHSCDRENVYVILQSLLQAEEETESVPEKIIYYYKEGDAEAQTLLEDIDIEVDAQCYKNNNLEIFVQHLSDVQSFNLLQGEFAPKREGNAWLQPWKSVAAVAAFWLVLQLGFDAVLGTQLKQENIALTKKIETEFKRAIPDARKMTNMQKRVERRLNDLKSGGSGSREHGFLQLLSKTSSVLSEKDKVNIKAAVYRNNYIDVDLTAKTLQDIEQIKNKLEKVPGIKTVLSTTVEKDSVKGRLRLEAKG